MGGGFVVELQACFDDAQTLCTPRATAACEAIGRQACPDRSAQVLYQPVALLRIQLQGSIHIGKAEGIDHGTVSVGEGFGGNDIHAPVGQRGGKVREEAGPFA